MKNPYENIENELEGYKYVLELSISIDDPLSGENNDRLCICDTRDECIEEIKKHIKMYEDANKKAGAHISPVKPYNITRLDCYIHWQDEESKKTWWWSYGIFPVKYMHK